MLSTRELPFDERPGTFWGPGQKNMLFKHLAYTFATDRKEKPPAPNHLKGEKPALPRTPLPSQHYNLQA